MNKTCPYCAEEVLPAAKVCPHCRNWLSIFSLRNPLAGIVCFCIFFLILVIGLLTSMQRLLNPVRNFSPYRDSISVVESRMNFQPDAHDPSIYVVVVLTNKSELAWKNPQLDLRFFNQAGVFIDANSYSGGGVVQPHGDMAVRVKCRPCHPIAEYDSCKILVRSAVDPISRFY